MLAFSRQQTLAPQVLQLPDVVAEVSHLLKRLLGETVKLEVKHGRGLGAVRADPGQLEQVIVNLAVNARDAMVAKDDGGGTLTCRPIGPADDVRRMGSDVLPIGDYTALKVTDTGTASPSICSQDLRALLHHQGSGEGDRARPFHRLRHRQAVGADFHPSAETQVRQGARASRSIAVRRAQPGGGAGADKAKARDKAERAVEAQRHRAMAGRGRGRW
jgi:hypothetical protein